MIKITIDDAAIRRLMTTMPKQASRAAERALDRTAFEIRDNVRAEIRRVFDNPVPYTINSLQVTKTYRHNMKASVWFKDPERMGDHYLVPQVRGTVRKTKGFERAFDDTKMVPGRGARRDRYGNVSVGQIRQVLSVLGRGERVLGFQSNITARSAKRNTKPRDYVYLPRGSGKLPPGVYERVVTTGRAATAKAKRTSGLGFGTYQKGKQKGAYIRARGLQGILIKGRQHARTKPRLDFYGVAERTYLKTFRLFFAQEFRKEMAR